MAKRKKGPHRFRPARPSADGATRNLRLNGYRTTMRLEDEFWTALDIIAYRKGMDGHELIQHILDEAGASRRNASCEVRCYCIAWMTDQAEEAGAFMRLKPESTPEAKPEAPPADGASPTENS